MTQVRVSFKIFKDLNKEYYSSGMKMLYVRHQVSASSADTIQQWFNAGGQLQFYDYDLETYLNVRDIS